MEPTTEKKTGGKSLYLFIIAALVILCAVLGYKLLNSSKTVAEKTETISTLDIEKLQLTNDLQEMLIQYDTLNITNEKMSAEVIAQQEQIKEMLKQIEKHKDDSYIIGKLKKEALTLREIMKGYLVTIDSLNTLNKNLEQSNVKITQELGEVKTKATVLESENKNLQNVINVGSVLPATNFSALAIKMRNNGKQLETDRAAKTEVIKTCLTIGENRISQQGRKTIFLRIISPDGVVLTDVANSDSRFEFNGVSGKYTIKRDIEYQNKPQDVCIFYNINSELSTGKYIIEAYESGTLIAKGTIDLK
jgi:hypothetical protein